nr:MAG TPA: hypothetical protein [Caudoviricetes sp.]
MFFINSALRPSQVYRIVKTRMALPGGINIAKLSSHRLPTALPQSSKRPFWVA